jgi:hypothetical protein
MFQIRDNLAGAGAAFERRAERQLPYVTARALTDAAFAARTAIRAEMQRVFDRPTPFTMSAFQVRPARKDALVASVETKAKPGGHYLSVQERGGTRPQTRVERRLADRLAYSSPLYAVIPARGAQLDRYGNWSSGERNRALSALGAQADPLANTTERSRKRNPGRAEYFVPREGLRPGIYRRQPATGRVDIVAIFTSVVPTYTPRFPWREVADKAAREAYPAAFAQRMREVLASTR